MDEKDWATVFKSLKNKNYLGAVIGEVIEEMPNLKISIDDKIVVEKDQLVISKHVLKDYEREFEIEGKITFNAKTENAMAGVTGQATESPNGHPHQIKLNENDYKAKGKIKWTDSLLKGDIVLLIASMDNQLFFLMDKGEIL
ncbi:MAG: DUF2577 domain-containing protein [Fusobacteriaceae bacterium]|nr:DUF2577 domain-containing protein [Fusobacteriaceae bacterium]MBN2838039.1 DUF2577 domain-containing protein [Fusobacteriaceae bacterium]